MSRWFRVMLSLVALAALCVQGVGFAESGSIDITYNGVQVYINGVKTGFVDEYGQEIEPFIYNGKVYLPLSSLAEALGMSYEWDGSAMTAYMGVSQGEAQYLLEVCPPYEWEDTDFFTTADGTSFNMAGKSYTNGMMMQGYSSGNGGYVLVNLNGAYDSMSFTVGHVDGAEMNDGILQVFLDGNLAQEITVSAEGLPQQVTVPLNYALSVKLCIKSDGWTWIGLGELTLQ